VTERTGEVFDLGYQHYEGPREGRIRAIKSLWLNGFRSALGLGRGGRAKLLPGLLLLAVLGPASVAILIASIVGPEGDLLGPNSEFPTHAQYYSIISLMLLIFSAIIVPELLIPDRRDGVLSLYLVRPLTSIDYLFSRWSSFFVVALALAYAGQALLLIGFLLASNTPVDYFRDNWLDIPRFLAAGVAVAIFTTTIPMAVATITTRRIYAAVIVIGIFILSQPIAFGLTGCEERTNETVIVTPQGQEIVFDRGECEPITGSSAKWFALLDIGRAPIQINNMIFNADPDEDTLRLIDGEHPAAVPIAWYVLLVAIPAAVLVVKYRRMTI